MLSTIKSARYSITKLQQSSGIYRSNCTGSTAMKSQAKSTFSMQDSLPRLPVPDLEPTLSRWLKSIEPLVKGQELDECKRVTADFAKPGGVGQLLQSKLLDRKQLKSNTSWLSEWWLSYAYMSYREPLSINVSFSYLFDDLPKLPSQLARAADLTAGFLMIKQLIETETMPPEDIKGVHQCMAAYKNMFGTCRIPSPGDDVIIHCKPEESRHIIVACNNLFYKVDVYDQNGYPLPRDELEDLLGLVQADAQKQKGSVAPIGILTCEHRDRWMNIRNELLKDSTNKASLEIIEKAAFVVNLDSYTPTSKDDACKALLHGKGANVSSSNRYFDKAFNIVVFPDGRAGFIGEHSGIDGYPATMISDAIWEAEVSRRGLAPSAVKKAIKAPTLLKFNTSSTLDENIKQAANYHQQNVNNVELTLLNFNHYGQNFIKSAGVSPDGYVQMAFQLAYRRLHKAYAPTYESCSTRKYLHGRTEVGRSLSNSSVDFCEGMENPSLSIVDKYALFKKACESHIQYIREASDGYGCDRHILGLKFIAKDEGMTHPFFSLPAHGKTTNWQLSTSQLPSKHSITGYGPVVPDGYGLFYNIRAEQLNFHISSFNSDPNTDAIKLSKSLTQTLLDIQHMCMTASPKAKL